MRPRLAGPVAVVAAVLALAGPGVVAGPAPAWAQQTERDGPAIEAVLTAVSSVVGRDRPLGYRLEVRNRGGVALRDLRVQARLGTPIQTRSELQRQAANPDVEPDGLGLIGAWSPEDPATTVAPGAALALPPRTDPLPSWLGVRSPGMVLPLRVEVSASSDQGAVSDRAGTFVVALDGKDGKVEHPLRLSLLVPLHEPPHRNPAGDFVDDELAAQLDRGGSLGAIAAELARPEAPRVSMVIDPLLTDEATAMSGSWRLKRRGRLGTVPPGDPRSKAAGQFLADLRQAADRNLPAVFPYASADLPALVRAGSTDGALAPALYSKKRFKEWLGPDPDSALAWPVPGAIDAATLDLLAEAGAESVVLDPHLLPSTAGTTQNATVGLAAGLGPLEHALVPDAALSAALDDPRGRADPAAWAQRVLAETALTWLELPNSSRPRGVLLAPPQDWRPDPAFFRALLHGLEQASSPWLQVVPARELAGQVPQGPSDEQRLLAPYTAADANLGLPAKYLRGVARTTSLLRSFRRMVVSDFPALDDFDRNLLIATSSDWRPANRRARGSGFVRAVGQGMKAVTRQIGVQGTRVTLTSRRGAIPVTVTNASNHRLRVVLRLSSTRVDLPLTTDAFTLEPNEPLTRRIQVETRTTGSFPIQVEVLTPDGGWTVGGGEVRLVSTAFNRVALILAGGAGGFLLLWWGNKTGWRRRREPSPPAAEGS